LGLLWPNNFRLLGIDLTNNLIEVAKNYLNPLDSIEKEVEKWFYRMPTALGRAEILKTSLMSKLTHYPIVLPNPPKRFFKDLKDKFNHFIWGGDLNKISYERMCVNTREGGMNVIDLEQFWSVLKISWFTRALDSDDIWAHYLNELLQEQEIENVEALLKLGDLRLQKVASIITHPFWQDAIYCLASLKKAYHCSHQERLFQTTPYETALFLRTKNEQNSCFLENEFPAMRRWLHSVQDVRIGNSIAEYNQITRPKANFVAYSQLYKQVIKAQNELEDPLYPNKTASFRSFLLKNKGTANFRKLLNKNGQKNLEDFNITKIWHGKLGKTLAMDVWKKAFSKYLKFWIDPKFKYFQFRTLNRILGVNHLTSKFGIGIDDHCTFCKLQNIFVPETIEHILYQCPHAIAVWNDLILWEPFRLLGMDLSIEKVIIYMDKPGLTHQWLVNAALIWTKYYIWTCKCKDTLPTSIQAKYYVKKNAKIAFYIHECKGKNSDFDIFESPENFERNGNSVIRL
jgi:hypothetical protein